MRGTGEGARGKRKKICKKLKARTAFAKLNTAPEMGLLPSWTFPPFPTCAAPASGFATAWSAAEEAVVEEPEPLPSDSSRDWNWDMRDGKKGVKR